MTADLEADIELARRMGAVADEVAMHYFESDYQWGWKGDGSPVTEADLAVEEALLRILAAERPGDQVLSEERGVVGGAGSRRWLLDPIDGTSYFLDGSGAWGSHIALEVDGEIVVGLISRPTLGRSWWAAQGAGTWTSEGERLAVTTTASLDGARLAGYVRPGSRWRAAVAQRAMWLHSASPILDLIEGRLDAILSEGGYPWDHAPAVVLIREAGGRFTDLEGGDRIDLRGGLYSNGRLDEEIWSYRT
ncbi:MAG: glucose-1-phosphate thymidylyltransferase [Acidimicrobiia bacterium]|nr:glucose-1-phosphate thymidylyltransferase [Acidimicrobiia bacterium]